MVERLKVSQRLKINVFGKKILHSAAGSFHFRAAPFENYFFQKNVDFSLNIALFSDFSPLCMCYSTVLVFAELDVFSLISSSLYYFF